MTVRARKMLARCGATANLGRSGRFGGELRYSVISRSAGVSHADSSSATMHGSQGGIIEKSSVLFLDISVPSEAGCVFSLGSLQDGKNESELGSVVNGKTGHLSLAPISFM